MTLETIKNTPPSFLCHTQLSVISLLKHSVCSASLRTQGVFLLSFTLFDFFQTLVLLLVKVVDQDVSELLPQCGNIFRNMAR